MLSPIVLFTYDRHDHTRLTVEALQANYLAKGSNLIIFSDAPRSQEDEAKVLETREYLSTINGFRSVQIILRETNYGLARNIVEGVSQVCSSYSTVIVLEDDIVTAPHFLTYMNKALSLYSNHPEVWHISGWNSLSLQSKQNFAFCWRMMECWGWGTWSDRWQHFHKDSKQLIGEFDHTSITEFNLDDTVDYWSQVEANAAGKIDTWAVFWYATIFRNRGLCISPYQSLVRNIGFDGSGVHCDSNHNYENLGQGSEVINFPKDLTEDQNVVNQIKLFHSRKLPLPYRVKRLIRRIYIGELQISDALRRLVNESLTK